MVSGGVSLFCGLVCIALRRPLLAMFTSDEEILLYASRYVVVLLLSHWMYAVFSALMCMVNGVGLIRFTTLISLLMLWAVRIPSAYLIAEHFDGTWVMLCFPISFAFGMIGMILYTLLSPMWKRKMNCSSRRTA